MKINKNNFEVYIIDFADGNLTPSEEKDLKEFLRNNPDLSEEVKGLESMILVPETVLHPRKENLLKPETFCGIKNRFDYLCIAKVENDLSHDEEIELAGMLNASASKDLLGFEHAKLIPDKAEGFINKSKLKRYRTAVITRNILVSLTSAAAIALILFGAFSILTTLSRQIPNEIAAVPITIVLPKEVGKQLEEIGSVFKEVTIPVPLSKEHTNEKLRVSAYQAETTEALAEVVREQELIPILPRINFKRMRTPRLDIQNKQLLAFVSIENEYKIPEQEVSQTTPSRTRVIGLFEIAQLGFNRLSDLTGSDINLNADKDANGSIKKIKFESKLFALSIPIKKKE